MIINDSSCMNKNREVDAGCNSGINSLYERLAELLLTPDKGKCWHDYPEMDTPTLRMRYMIDDYDELIRASHQAAIKKNMDQN